MKKVSPRLNSTGKLALGLGPGPSAGHLTAQTAQGLALLAPAQIGWFFVPALFLELTEDAFLGQLALQGADRLLHVVVLNLNLDQA